MNLLPQDVFIMLKLAVSGQQKWTYHGIGHELAMSPSMVHDGVKRATKARLYDSVGKRPIRTALLEFIIHGVKYAFPPDIGAVTRGVATAHSSLFFKDSFYTDPDAGYVWPNPKGADRGMSLSPLYKSASAIASKDQVFYQTLCMVDAIRIGRAREVELASKCLNDLIKASERQS